MARKARIVVPGFPHHITQRTIRRLPLFLDIADRAKYIQLLSQQCRVLRLKVYAYCLMENHVHLVVVPPNEDSMSKVIRNVHSRYAQFFNAKNGFAGHLMQSRFFSCPMKELYMWRAIRYVERNPVAAGLVDHAADYKWSSAAYRSGLVGNDPIVSEIPNRDLILDWYQWLKVNDDESVADIRAATVQGTWLGTERSVPMLKGTERSVPLMV